MTQDNHIYSTFSGARNTIEENVAEAERIGLTELAFADHVRADSRWLPAYVAAVRSSSEQTTIALHCAVEARILDIYGRLDLPAELTGIDAVYVVGDQAPSPDGPMNSRATRERIEAGALDPQMILRWIVDGTAAALHRHEHVVIGHLFSVLPALGLEEEDVSVDLIDSLAVAAAESDARIVVDERRRCPTVRTLRPFLRHGVPLLLATGSQSRETIGCYDYCAGVLRELREPVGSSPPVETGSTTGGPAPSLLPTFVTGRSARRGSTPPPGSDGRVVGEKLADQGSVGRRCAR